MRILHLTDHYSPVLGGIESHVAALAARQAARGDEVTVLTSTRRTADGRRSDDTGPVTVRRARSLHDGRSVMFSNYDIVHVHLSVVAPFSAPVAVHAARRGAPTIVTLHSLWSGLGPLPAAAAAVVGLRRAPVVWSAVSRLAADQLAARLPGHPDVRVLPNAVSVAPRARTPEPADGRPVRLVSTMRVARRKRPLQLLRMFESLGSASPVPVELTIIGDGPLRPRLERRLHRTDLQRSVTVTGRLEPAEVLDLLSTADIYVAPAVLESFGLAALEARCTGLPVVGRARSGMTDFIRHGVEGMLCESDADMVALVRELVVDTGLRWRISEHNRTIASNLTWSHAMDAHDAAYAATCSPGVSTRPPLASRTPRP